MATKILIPTPLRPFTDKKDAVEANGKYNCLVTCFINYQDIGTLAGDKLPKMFQGDRDQGLDGIALD